MSKLAFPAMIEYSLSLLLHLFGQDNILSFLYIKANKNEFVCVNVLHPSQQFLSHDRTISCLPRLN